MSENLTLEELDALEHYKIIADEDELKWFYDHCVYPLKRNEAYAFCLSSRYKKLSDEERSGHGVHSGRSEMLDPTVVLPDFEGNTTYARWKKGIRAYECHKETFTTPIGTPYLAKTLVLYFHINPCDELYVVKDLKKYIQIHEQELIDSAMKTEDRTKALNNLIEEISCNKSVSPEQMERIKVLSTKSDESGVNQSIYKVCKTLSKMKRLQFDNVGTKYWIDFDLDIKKEYRGTEQEAKVIKLWTEMCLHRFGKGNFVLIKTDGGLHTIVKKHKFCFNPDWFINEFKHFVSTDIEVPKGYVTKKTAISLTNPFVKGEPKNYTFCPLTRDIILSKIGNKDLWQNWIQLSNINGGDTIYFTPSNFIDELEFKTNPQIPLPGTYQYGKCVRVLNKEDFE